MKNTIRILITGDICPAKSPVVLSGENDSTNPFGQISEFFHNADYVVSNLECPLTDHPKPINKTGPCIWANPSFAAVLKKSGIDALGLANNHIRDAGDQAVLDTRTACHESGMATFGAGKDLEESGHPHIVNIEGIRVCFLAMAEHEFCIADTNQPGANPLSPIRFVRFCREHRNQYDILVVLYHGGIEQYPYPSPAQQDLCRFMVEEGANLVLCQHSHCIGCAEKSKQGHIVYGQGNFFFPYNSHKNLLWYEGLVVELVVDRYSKSCDIIIHPIRLDPSDQILYRLNKADSNIVLNEFHKRSHIVTNGQSVIDMWKQHCLNTGDSLLHSLMKLGRIKRKLISVLPCLHPMNKVKYILRTMNLLRCQSHHEKLLTVLEELAKSKQ
jgi:hypothetical protein